MKTIRINDKNYFVENNEFIKYNHPYWTTLELYPELNSLELQIGLIRDLKESFKFKNFVNYGSSYGGYIPLELSLYFENISIISEDKKCISKNVELHNCKNIYFEEIENIDITRIENDNVIILGENLECSENFVEYIIKKINYKLYIPKKYNELFLKDFYYYIDTDGIFDYNNLIELCIMVKNAGDGFQKILEQNLPYIDRWTILDTGSTDNTISIIKDVLKDKKGNLYTEPFINFRDSRNRCLDLAGTRCKYTIMLDDTYILTGRVREFLENIRSDQRGESYNVFIQSTHTDSIIYGSNRILKTAKKLRYKYLIHEVIDSKERDSVIQVPIEEIKITDVASSYMSQRTAERKQSDLKLLHYEIEKDPDDPRNYYYLAQTYSELNDWNNAIDYYIKRATHHNSGFEEEIVDSYFNVGLISNIRLNKNWKTVKTWYKKAYECDKSRSDPLYMIGYNYELQGKKQKAYEYYKAGFKLGFPKKTRINIRQNIYNNLLPLKLAESCLIQNDWELGLLACKKYVQHNKPGELIISLINIFNLYEKCYIKNQPEKQIITFVADGGFKNWCGESINTEGVGGSETYIIEMSRKMSSLNPKYIFYVFCRTSCEGIFDNVHYLHINKYTKFIRDNNVHSSIISRYSQYLWITSQHVKNIYLVVHDLLPAGIILPSNINIFCMTNWHRDYFLKTYKMLEEYTHVFPNGINIEKFPKSVEIRKHSFIYSSFPNRGLIHLLYMFPKIKEKLPDAHLDIFCDLKNNWVQSVAGEEMKIIEKIIEENDWVTNHGWVSKDILRKYWEQAQIWLYPCTFKETFCITALEAAASQTLAVCTDLAALNNTVGNRGILIPGEPSTEKWQDEAISRILLTLNNPEIMNNFLQRNRRWAEEHDWINLANQFSAYIGLK